jgi:hypothetical protein
MSEQTVENRRYMVSVYDQEDAGGTLIFTYVPKDLQEGRGLAGVPKRVPQFIVAVRPGAGEPDFDWSGTPDDPGSSAREQIQAEITARMEERSTWIARVKALVDQVKQWAKEMNWDTRPVEKGIDDVRIGKYRVQALLMQEGTCRALLEPIARSSGATEGVVDLYLMPAYDDIASLYFYNNRWNVHYNMARGTNAVVPALETEVMPLSKETLAKVLAEMRQNAV